MLTVVSNPASAGEVVPTPDYRNDPYLQNLYASQDVVTLQAIAKPGFAFDYWAGDVGDIADTTQSTISFTMGDARTVTANFVALYTVTVNSGSGSRGFTTIETPSGSITSSADQPSISLECRAGTEVTIIAKAAEGYRFVSWRGDVSGSDSPKTVFVDGPKTMTAKFVGPAPSRWWLWVTLGLVGVFGALVLSRLVYWRMNRGVPDHPRLPGE